MSRLRINKGEGNGAGSLSTATSSESESSSDLESSSEDVVIQLTQLEERVGITMHAGKNRSQRLVLFD